MKRAFMLGLSALTLNCIAFGANAQLTTTKADPSRLLSNVVDDNTISANEYGVGNDQVFLGGGTGFGGTLGNGQLFMDFDANNLYVGFKAGANLNDIVVVYFDTRSGGFTDAQMNDNADGGRRAISNLTRDSNDVFPFAPDYALAIGPFGAVTFELAAGGDNSLIFKNFYGDVGGNGTNDREITISRADFDIQANEGVDFFAGYVSETNFASNESLPVQSFNNQGNPGFGGSGDVNWSRFNRFAPVPGPGALSVFLIGGLPMAGALLRRRQK